MATYSIAKIFSLMDRFKSMKILRPFRYDRYEPGIELTYELQTFTTAGTVKITLLIEKFIGGGFAGQVYQVRLKSCSARVSGLNPEALYAMKILIPPGRFARIFRNLLYFIGFGSFFQLQVNPAAARAGALWQKIIRRAAAIELGSEDLVADIHGTLLDTRLGSCGEILEWIDGRTWRLEADDHLNLLKKWHRGKIVNDPDLGSPEYRAKYTFMHDFVRMLHKIGAPELARQYEWTTCKSQPNCLKRKSFESDPSRGLVAVDFRAGLVLLPFLPMSPGDIKLIWQGLKRGSLVQFDRGNLKKLTLYLHTRKEAFTDLLPLIAELSEKEKLYRNSVPDITHNHLRLLFSRKLHETILRAAIQSWQIRNIIDQDFAEYLNRKMFAGRLFYFLNFIPLLGRFFLKLCGNKTWLSHYRLIFSNRRYFIRAIKAHICERLIKWHRAERINSEKVDIILHSFTSYCWHSLLSLLPEGLHRFFSDRRYFRERLYFLFIRPVKLYFDANLREEWLNEMLEEGKQKNILTDEDSQTISAQIKEPFIQKYLKSLAVHVCTIPLTQIVSVLIAIIYITSHPELPRAQAWGTGFGIIALFQVIPISPGSLARGLYVLFLVIRERDFKNYNIAVFLAFFKYIGYLAFPIQMTYRYAALARFMAGHWATEAVHIIPVFGEKGALLEHWIYNLFYNWPLTLRRQFVERSAVRAEMQPRYWHIPLLIILAAATLFFTDYYFLSYLDYLPSLRQLWWLIFFLPMLMGSAVTRAAKGMIFWKRVVYGSLSGFILAIISAGGNQMLGNQEPFAGQLVWRIFIFSLSATIGVLITELTAGEPKRSRE
ncbi:MAG: hypothetical protein JW996_00940 [Candidatus Cloacimonetes bacterium]|nr:hypothetical protein [Candidatus Cloacimonadota bacterium]